MTHSSPGLRLTCCDAANLLIAELDHRVKTVLAIVSVVISRTQETSGSMANFVAALGGRIKSMATTHELATNATKFGALSTANGHVSVRWGHRRNGHAHSRLSILWEERGGPNVPPQPQSGYGTSVTRDLMPYELGALSISCTPPRASAADWKFLLTGSVAATSQTILQQTRVCATTPRRAANNSDPLNGFCRMAAALSAEIGGTA